MAGRKIGNIAYGLPARAMPNGHALQSASLRLAKREHWIKIFGEGYERRAEVATTGGLSAHAGQRFLVVFGQAMEMVFCNHFVTRL